MKQLYIVTGAYGHLGNTIIKMLLGFGKNVRGLVMENDNSNALEGLNVEIVKGDICDSVSLDNLFKNIKGYEVRLIHTAGIVSIKSKFDRNLYNVNVFGTQNIIDKCKQYKIKRLIYISSVHAIEEAKEKKQISETTVFNEKLVKGFYAKTKAEATRRVLEAQEEGLDVIVIHPSGIIGPNDFGRGHSTQLVMDFLDGRLTAAMDGGYDFVDVRDVAKGVITAAETGKNGESYILSNRYFSVVDLTSLIAEVSGKRKIKTMLPSWFVLFTAPLAEFWYKIIKQTPLYTSYSIYTLLSNSNFSNAKAKTELEYRTRDMKETILDTIRFLEENNRIKYRIKYNE